jgi:hypothetical protein
MQNLRPQLWHRLRRRQVTVLMLIAALDGVVLAALGYAILSANSHLVLVVAPTYSVLFMVLACSLGALAARGLVSWPLVSGILLTGPVGGAVALWRFGEVVAPRRFAVSCSCPSS